MILFKRMSYKLKDVAKQIHSSSLRDNISRSVILGIETSCDDTGCAIVDSAGNILGEALHSQQQTHLENGGILPPIARDLHEKHIEQVVKDALTAAKMKLSDLDAIAATVKPGLAMSLYVGMKYGKHLAQISKKPFIPIHHMQAHALTIRMVDEVEFPFLVLLISGGHCLLAVVQSSTKFLLLGQSLDDAPGEALDKGARRLKLRNIPQYSKLCGGEAIERAAELGDPCMFDFTAPLFRYRDCNFSMAGIKNQLYRIIVSEETKYNVQGGQVVPSVYDICASFQHCITKHICHRVQRALEFVQRSQMIPKHNQTMVISGGVACNRYISQAVSIICKQKGFQLKIPPPRLCTDNGIMIAWNGVERWRVQEEIYSSNNLDGIDIETKSPLGEDIRLKVVDADIKCEWIKLQELYENRTAIKKHV